MEDELINAAECREIVKNSLRGSSLSSAPFQVLSHEVRPMGDEVLGFLGEYFRLIVQVECPADKVNELSFFVKSMPRGEETRKMIQREGMFGKEVRIYQELFSKWSQSFEPMFKWRPECYYTRPDMIVLEELDVEYRHLPYKGVFDWGHCQEMLKALAKMHASSLDFEKNSLKGDKLNKSFGHLMFETPLKKGNMWFNAGLELIYFVAKDYEGHFNGIKLPVKEEFMERLYDVFKFRDEVNDFEKVLCHLDLWQSNMFFKYSKNGTVPEHCIVVDFQISNYKSPILDVIIALFVSARREFRDREMDNCFKFYLEFLQKTLKDTFNFKAEEIEKLQFTKEEELAKLRKHFHLYGLIINCVFAPLTQFKPGTLARIERDDPQAYFELCNVSRNDYTKEYMEGDSYYKECVLEAVGELVEYLFKGQ